MSLFGVQQLENAVEESSHQNKKTTTAFEAVTQATEEQLSGVVKDAFKAGDQLQSGILDTILGALPGHSQTNSTAPFFCFFFNVNLL